jgi:membrane protein
MAKGPDSPTDMPVGSWKATFVRTFRGFQADDMMTWAAALTYYAVLSLFPALLVLVALLGVFGQYPETSDAVLRIVGSIGPRSAVETLETTIEDVVQNSGGAGALLGVGLLSAIWSASGYIGAFFKASNAIYNVQEGRGFAKLRPIQLGLTILFLVIVAFGSIVFVASGSILESLGNIIGLGSTATTVWAIVKWPVLAVAVMALIALLYWAAPNVRQPKLRWVTPGGAFGFFTLVIASGLFGLYVANFGSYNKTYGTLAFVPLFLTWLWIANLALLFGAEFDAELARQREIEHGLRPVDADPFLPVRDEPDPPKTPGLVAREQAEEIGGAGAADAPATEQDLHPPTTRAQQHQPTVTVRRRTGGLLGRLRRSSGGSHG